MKRESLPPPLILKASRDEPAGARTHAPVEARARRPAAAHITGRDARPTTIELTEYMSVATMRPVPGLVTRRG